MPALIQEGVELKDYTTLHVGGEARYFARVETEAELQAALQFAKQAAVPLLVIGGGSNVLCKDDGFAGLVIFNCMKGRRVVRESEADVEIAFGAGEMLDDCVAWTVAEGLWGLENLSAIPGTIGATPIQNVGAYGVEVSSLILSVRAIHEETCEEKIFSTDECCFSYRDSFFKTPAGKKWIVVAVRFLFSRTPQPQLSYPDLASLLNGVQQPSLSDIRAHVIAVREKKFPDWSVVGTAGSFFKNPLLGAAAHHELIQKYPTIPSYMQPDGQVKVSLGYILDKVCGLKGYREGKVGLFESQALVLVAYDGATAADIKSFAQKITNIVYEKTSIMIETEVQYV